MVWRRGPRSHWTITEAGQQSRFLRLTWISRDCLQAGDQAGMDAVRLRVRVGLVTRTELVPFGEAFVLGAARRCPA